MTAILGISAFYHDAAAALVIDGRIVAAAQEERFTRRKHDAEFPREAIQYCLREAGLRVEELDYVGFYDKPLLKFDRLLETYLGYAPRGFRSFVTALPIWLQKKLHLQRELFRGLDGAYRKRFVFTEHHESHAASRSIRRRSTKPRSLPSTGSASGRRPVTAWDVAIGWS